MRESHETCHIFTYCFLFVYGAEKTGTVKTSEDTKGGSTRTFVASHSVYTVTR